MSEKHESRAKGNQKSRSRPGFTMAEMLVGSTVMLIIIVATLSLYMRSNKVAVDQNMYAELQHDGRSAMYFVARDIRMAGAGLPIEFSGFYFEGTDNESQSGAEVTPDRLLLMGNMEDPLNLNIDTYSGSSVVVNLEDYSFEQYPYPDEYYDNKMALILPNPSSGCLGGAIRQITQVTHSTGGTNERLNFSPGLAPDINPPGGLSPICDDGAFNDGLVTFIEVKEYWLDVTGNYPGLTAGEDGYIGNGAAGILYMTLNAVHYPLSQNVENLQFEYNGDLDNDGDLDGFLPWQATWTLDQISRIRQIRIMVLGRTPRAYVSISGRPDPNMNIYKRPPLSNTVGADQPDKHRRFLLESTSSVRNLTINIYNTGTR